MAPRRIAAAALALLLLQASPTAPRKAPAPAPDPRADPDQAAEAPARKLGSSVCRVFSIATQPVAMAMSSTGALFAAEVGTILQWSPSGSPGTPTPSPSPGETAQAMAIDSLGNILASFNSGVRMGPAGTALPNLVIPGVVPWGLAVDEQDNLYVPMLNDNRVDRYNSTGPGTWSSTFTTIITGVTQPSGLVIQGFTLFVAEHTGHRVTKWEPPYTSGTVVAGNGLPGGLLEQLENPRGMAVDPTGLLYVADGTNHRVVAWSASDSEGVLVADAVDGVNLQYPFDIALGQEELYFTDFAQNRVVACSLPSTTFTPSTTMSTATATSTSTSTSSWSSTSSTSMTASSTSSSSSSVSTSSSTTRSSSTSSSSSSSSSISTSSSTSSSSTSSSSSSSSLTSSTSSSTSSSSTSSSSSSSSSTSSTSSTRSSSSTSSPSSSSSSTSSSSVSTSSTTTSTSSSSSTSSTSSSSSSSSLTSSSTSSSSSSASTSSTSSSSATSSSSSSTTTTPEGSIWPCLLLSAVFDVEIDVFDVKMDIAIARGVELYAFCDVPDLSQYGLGSKEEEETLPSLRVSEGEHIYAVTQTVPATFARFFGFAPNVSDLKVRFRGTEPVTLFHRGQPLDVYGGTGDLKLCDYTEGFAYRKYGLPTGQFVASDWHVAAIDGRSRNRDETGLAIPVGTYKVGKSAADLFVEVGVRAAGRSAVSALRESGLAKAVVETDVGKIAVFNTSQAATPGGRASLRAEAGVVASISSSELQRLQREDSAIAILATNASAPWGPPASSAARPRLADLKGRGGELLAVAPVDLSIYDSRGRYVPKRFEEPVLIKLPGTGVHGQPSMEFRQACAYLERQGESLVWSTWGVWTATPQEVAAAGEDPDGTYCWTIHLSIFAAIWEAFLGCTNAELLTEEGFRAFRDNADWHTSEPARIVLILLGAAMLMVLVGGLWELYAFRLGQTYEPGKPVRLCQGIVQANLKLLKHKYTAIIVYVKEVATSLRAGRLQLRTSSLTSGVQRFLGLRWGISVACVSQHCWNGGGWIETKAALPKTTVCRKLEFHAGKAEEVMQKYMVGGSPAHVITRFVMTFFALHPLLDAMRVGAGAMTVAKRTMLQVAAFYGVLACNAMIFNFSGERSWEVDADCPISPTSHFFIAVATAASIVFNVIPNGLLNSLGKQVHGRPAWNAFFWTLTAAYLFFSWTLLGLAMANLNRKDEGKWSKSLEYACLMKFVIIPAAQTLRHWLLLEVFLWEDRKLDPSKQFRVWMGLRHPNEAQLTEESKEEAESMARQAISAEELVNFFSFLGDKVMVDYDPETSTSEDVMGRAIKLLCRKPPPLKDHPVFVEVVGFANMPDAPLFCSVLHLGPQTAGERPCLAEQSIDPGAALSFATCLAGLAPEHAVGFLMKTEEGRIVGMACVAASEVIKRTDHQFSLQLRELQGDGSEPTGWPTAWPATLSPRDTAGKARRPLLVVRVRLPSGYLHAAGRNELWKLKGSKDLKEGGHAEVHLDVIRSSTLSRSSTSLGSNQQAAANAKRPVRCGAFCECVLHDFVPPDRMVVHSQKGSFLHLVCAVLADALQTKDAYGAVRKKLLAKDFNGLSEMLREAQCHDIRYWIEMFAMDSADFDQAGGHWHEDLLPALPTVMRSMRREACHKMVAEIEAGRSGRTGPLQQLVVLDRGCQLLWEETSLSEAMLAKVMRVKQRLTMHPELMHQPELGDSLRKLARQLGGAFNSGKAPWTLPYLADKQAVFDVMKDLILASVKEVRGDQPSTWEELHLTDVALVVGSTRNAPEKAADAADAADAAADADVDA